jgi:transposase
LDGFTGFLDDGRIEIDSNSRAQHAPDALGKKNTLSAGSDDGAENWAMLASLIETCKLHRVKPEAYFIVGAKDTTCVRNPRESGQ